MASVQEHSRELWRSTGLSSLQQALPGLSLTAKGQPQPVKPTWSPFTGQTMLRPPTPPQDQAKAWPAANDHVHWQAYQQQRQHHHSSPRNQQNQHYHVQTQYEFQPHAHAPVQNISPSQPSRSPRTLQVGQAPQAFQAPQVFQAPNQVPNQVSNQLSPTTKKLNGASKSFEPGRAAPYASIDNRAGETRIQKTSLANCRNCSQPAKTGFALWVGNLPPKTTMKDLCWLFSTPEIQSIYLIYRTGCAFVNYTSEDGLIRAEAAFRRRGGRIRDQKLVIKAQRDTDPAPNAVTPPQSSDEEGTQVAAGTGAAADAAQPTLGATSRYFICKSLTIADLEAAQRDGTWTTQIHNRAKINEAFRTSQNTYFIFSANRSSAFYGIARMETPLGNEDRILEEPACQCTPESSFIIEPTPATENALDGLMTPAGRIVQDVVRGCIFWEVENCPHVEVEALRWTGPCKIQWMTPKNSVVEFSNTKQLRNPLNQNKPIKVARDGTEIEPTVASRLVKMFQ